MASSMKNVKASAKDDLKQQEITQAVVIADNFDQKFSPLTFEKPAVLLPVVNVTLLDYVLHSLRECGIQEAFIFCCSHNQQIRSYVSSSKWSGDDSPMSVVVISSASFMSMGDILRELDSKALIRNDFILIKGDVITTFPLCSILEEHRKRRQLDKSSALTLIYRKALPKHKTRCKEHDFLVAVESASNKIRYYQRINTNKTLNVPLEVFQENEEITVHYDLLDTHISICSPCVPPLFSDNFDYQNLDDFVKGLLVNEELLGNSMYIHISQSGYGASISNLYMYDTVSQDILNRWAYPIVPDVIELNGLKYSYYRHNIYKQPGVEIGRNCLLKQNVAIKGGTKIGENTIISNSVIGENCIIGSNVEIKGCYIWKNVKIGDSCKLETCLLSDNVVIHKNVSIKPGCVIGSEVVISENVSVPAFTKLQSNEFNEDDDFGEDDFPDEKKSEDKPCDVKLVGENGHGYLYSVSNDSEEEDNVFIEDVWGKTDEENDLEDEETVDSSSSVILSPAGNLSEDSEGAADDYDEDASLFYSEVFESLQRGVEEKIKAENMILEINSSKHAYNVTMKEVNTLLIKAILKLPLDTEETLTAQQYLSATKKNLTFFQPLISNYIRSSESQLDCLSSVEEFMKNNDELAPAVIKVLHFWYEADILNEPVILKWYNNLTDESHKIKKQASAFISWLQEADEESD